MNKPTKGYPYHTIKMGGSWDPIGVLVLYVIAAVLIFVVIKVYRMLDADKQREPAVPAACECSGSPPQEVSQ